MPSRDAANDPRLGDDAPDGPIGCIACLIALAIRVDQMIRYGVVADQAEAARLGHVTRARLTQVINLLLLAPDIQEQILFLPKTERGRDSVTEPDLRPIAAEVSWEKQRQIWDRLDHHNARLPADNV